MSNISKKKVLITGSGGFIFSNFIRKAIYEKHPYNLVSIDKVTRSNVLNNIYSNKNHQFYIGDISDDHFVNVIFEAERPDIIIHGAAESSVDASLKDPNIFIKSNVMGTQVLANAAIKWGAKQFLLISTDEVYGHLTSKDDSLWKEDAPMNPRNPYSASKASAELVIKAAHETHGLQYFITRSSNNYGPRQTHDKLIPRVIKCILENKPIPIYGEGKQLRNWMHVSDNCAGILKVLESGEINNTYNISSDEEYENVYVVNKICDIMGRGKDLITFIEDPRKNGHDFRYGVDSSKLKSLGWNAKTNFNDHGLESTINWYLSNQWFLK